MDTVAPPGDDAITLADLDPDIDVWDGIERLRRDRNAVILAHFYQDPEIQDLADFVGDSLDLSRKAASTDADVIAFCGVRFMAEVAKILSPEKTVILPDAEAGCSLEEACPPGRFRRFREAHPDHLVVTYINCSAEVKAQSDIIVTSTNAEHIIRQLPEDRPILFAPDRHLGAYISRRTGREMTLWPGVCIVHDRFSERELIKLKARHRGARVAAHPECQESILGHADHVGLDALDPGFRAGRAGQGIHHRHRTPHYPPDGKGGPPQDLHPGPRRRRRLQLRRVSVHGTEHHREALSCPG